MPTWPSIPGELALVHRGRNHRVSEGHTPTATRRTPCADRHGVRAVAARQPAVSRTLPVSDEAPRGAASSDAASYRALRYAAATAFQVTRIRPFTFVIRPVRFCRSRNLLTEHVCVIRRMQEHAIVTCYLHLSTSVWSGICKKTRRLLVTCIPAIPWKMHTNSCNCLLT